MRRITLKISAVNGYSGEYLKNIFAKKSTIDGVEFQHDGSITRSTSIPFKYEFKQSDGTTPLKDFTGYKLVFTFDTVLECSAEADLLIPSVEFDPINPATDATFKDAISDDVTFSLPLGTIYISLKLIDNAGVTGILDMVKTQVMPCVSDRRS